MKKHEKYLETLKTFSDYVTIDEWAHKFAKIYPDEAKNTEESEKTAIRKLIKNITSLVSTGKWSDVLSIDRHTKPQKVKYITDDDKEKIAHKEANIDDGSKGVKSIKFESFMESIKLLPNDEDLPSRASYSYLENIGDIHGYKEFIAFEMAKKSKNVIDITQKLDYIKKIIDGNQKNLERLTNWLLDYIYWEHDFEGDAPESTINPELKKEYLFIAELPANNFIEKIDFLITEKEPSNEKSESVLCLKVIADYLQNKLKEEYFIYKEGYFFLNDEGYFHPDQLIHLDIMCDKFSTSNLRDEIKLTIGKIINRKTDNIKQNADMFFIYDYYNKRKAEDNTHCCILDIKFELTKYHGIEIEGIEEKLSYDECLTRYEEFKGLKASFYTVEKTITNKLKLMEEFIDKELYRYILFY